jgi:hypothetical protein
MKMLFMTLIPFYPHFILWQDDEDATFANIDLKGAKLFSGLTDGHFEFAGSGFWRVLSIEL